MESLTYESKIPITHKPSPLVWVAAGFVFVTAAACVAWGSYAFIQAYRTTGASDLGALGIAIVVILLGMGLAMVEAFAVILKLLTPSEAIGTLFCAPAFMAVPPLLEMLLSIGSSRIHRSIENWHDFMLILMIGTICGFIGFVHLRWSGTLRRPIVALPVETIAPVAHEMADDIPSAPEALPPATPA